jgi:hypothetical protein
MNKLFISYGVLLAFALFFEVTNITKDCKCKTIPLYGRVKIVQASEDFRVRVKQSHADLDVQKVEHFPNECGKWQFVTYREDFSIRIVESSEDFSIRYVEHFPGVRQ